MMSDHYLNHYSLPSCLPNSPNPNSHSVGHSLFIPPFLNDGNDDGDGDDGDDGGGGIPHPH